VVGVACNCDLDNGGDPAGSTAVWRERPFPSEFDQPTMSLHPTRRPPPRPPSPHGKRRGPVVVPWKPIFDRALEHQRNGRFKEAIEAYAELLEVEPRFSPAWANMGIAYRSLGAFEAAVPCYIRAVELDPAAVGTYGSLGNVLKDLGRLDEALDAHRRLVEAKPDDAGARHNYGVAFRQAGRFEEALAQFEEACRLRPGDPAPKWDRALALLHLGRFKEGWAAYTARWQVEGSTRRRSDIPEWRGEPLDGRTLLVYPEQGFGDAIIGVRFLP